MPHSLRRGVPRLYRDHRGPRGRAYREEFHRIEERLGGTIPPTLRTDAAMVADLYATWRGYAEQVAAAERQRREGRGRRPSSASIRSIEKRQALTLESYQRARCALEARLAAVTGDSLDFLGGMPR